MANVGRGARGTVKMKIERKKETDRQTDADRSPDTDRLTERKGDET